MCLSGVPKLVVKKRMRLGKDQKSFRVKPLWSDRGWIVPVFLWCNAVEYCVML